MNETAGVDTGSDLKPGRVIERYRIVEPLGSGGLAVVYRAQHETLGTEHALKMLRIATPSIQRRLVNEGRVQARLRHPNVVAVHDVLESPFGPVLVMDIVDGPALDEWLQTNEPDLDQAMALFHDIVAGVAAAHAHGVVHRDLKPANILLEGPELTARVTDFGLAKALLPDTFGDNRKATRPGVTMGTPAYMAPEQIRDAKTVDERADMFSLGCILYELMCGRPAFTGADNMEIFSAVSLSDYPRPRSVVPDLPLAVQSAIEGLLQADADERIPDCATLLTVLSGGSWTPVPRTTDARTWQETPAPSLPAETFPPANQPGVRGWTAPNRTDASSIVQTRRTWAIALVGVGMAGSLTLGGATVLGYYGAETSASQRIAEDFSERLALPFAFADARVTPDTVALQDVVVGDEAAPVLTAHEMTVAVGALEVFSESSVPDSLVLSDVVVDLSSAGARRGLKDMTQSLASDSPMRIEDLTLQGGAGDSTWTFHAEQVVWNPRRGWTASAWELDDVLRGQQLRWETSGLVTVQGFDTVEGNLSTLHTSALGAVIPAFLGGTASNTAWQEWGESLSALLPGEVSQVDFEGGRVRIADGSVALVRATVGPSIAGYTPVSILMTDDLGRVSITGESTPEGELHMLMEARRMPLESFATGLNERLATSEVVLVEGRMDVDTEATLTPTALQYDTHARYYDVAFRGEAFGMSATKGAVVADYAGTLPLNTAFQNSAAQMYSAMYTSLVLGEVE